MMMSPSTPEVRRRLAAILAADVVGYTRLMEAHEENTHTRLMRLRSEVLDPGVTAQNGRIVKNTGDGFLATFDTARDAARCVPSLLARNLGSRLCTDWDMIARIAKSGRL
ncbi:hypothetical protein [Bradyrhizobium sp. USDA 3364]